MLSTRLRPSLEEVLIIFSVVSVEKLQTFSLVSDLNLPLYIASIIKLSGFMHLLIMTHDNKTYTIQAPSSIITIQLTSDIFLGDGTEDISCKMDKSNWTVDDDVTGQFTPSEAEKFWESLHIHFVSFLVFPCVFTQQAPFPIKISQVPPVLHPRLAGDVLFNTEFKKNSYLLKNIHNIQGALYHLYYIVLLLSSVPVNPPSTQFSGRR